MLLVGLSPLVYALRHIALYKNYFKEEKNNREKNSNS